MLALLVLPLLAGLFPQPAAAASTSWTRIPVLMYHYIRWNPDPRDRAGFALSVTPAAFHEQMDYLARNHFNVIPLSRAVAAIRTESSLPPRPIVLTFDDGYADFFTSAVPEMRRYGFTGTDYVIPNRVGRGSFMTWSQVIASDRLGFTIGAHTMNHVALAAVPTWRALAEMSQSKRALEQMVGHPVIECDGLRVGRLHDAGKVAPTRRALVASPAAGQWLDLTGLVCPIGGRPLAGRAGNAPHAPSADRSLQSRAPSPVWRRRLADATDRGESRLGYLNYSGAG